MQRELLPSPPVRGAGNKVYLEALCFPNGSKGVVSSTYRKHQEAHDNTHNDGYSSLWKGQYELLPKSKNFMRKNTEKCKRKKDFSASQSRGICLCLSPCCGIQMVLHCSSSNWHFPEHWALAAECADFTARFYLCSWKAVCVHISSNPNFFKDQLVNYTDNHLKPEQKVRGHFWLF